MTTNTAPAVASTRLLQVQDLSVAFRTRGQDHVVVDRVGFELDRGRTLGIVGLGQIGREAVQAGRNLP